MAPKPKNNDGLKQGTLFSFFTRKPASASKASKPSSNKQTTTTSSSSSSSSSGTSAPTPSSSSKQTTTKRKASNTTTAEDDDKVKVGGRIEVYWKDDDEYYAAKVLDKRNHTKNRCQYYLEYEIDGQSEWLDLSQETFRILDAAAKEPSKKRRRIQEEGDDDGDFSDEVEFDGDDDEESAYEEQGDKEEEEEDDNWMVTDDEDDMEVAEQSSGKNKKKKLKAKASVKVTQHRSTTTTLSSSSTKSSRTTPKSSSSSQSTSTLHQFGHTPQTVTPAVQRPSPSMPQPSTSTLQSPLATAKTPSNNKTKDGAAPPKFVEGALNPAGSHVHNHLKFLLHPKDAKGRAPDHPEYNARTLRVDQNDWKNITKKKMTDAVQQWWDLKSMYYDTVLLFKTGKFYEMFHMDADVGVQVLGLMYMKGHTAHAGFPEISYGSMADKLVRAGYKVARVEQTETPEQLKIRKKKRRSGQPVPKVVNREVCSVLTLGTRTFCYLDEDTAGLLQQANSGEGTVGPLLAICEKPLEQQQSPPQAAHAADPDDQVTPVCSYGITMVDAMRGTVTIGEFEDDVLRSRMTTLLTSYAPSEILLQGGEQGASPTLQSLIKTVVQTNNPHPFRLEMIQPQESFPKSTALDAQIRRQLERSGGGGRAAAVQPWNVEETLQELHRRQYYPSASKKKAPQNGESSPSVSRWPPTLRAAVEGQAHLALASFGAALFYLQRNLIDAELLSMGIVQAYIPPTAAPTGNSAAAGAGSTSLQQLAQQQNRVEAGVEDLSAAPMMVSPTQGSEPQAPAAAPPASSSQHTSTATQLTPQDAESMNLEAQVNHMALDGTTLLNLEILTNNQDYKTKGSLWSKINYTKTPHGSRLLRAWLLRPLFRKAEIERRADAVEQLVSGGGAVALADAMSVLAKCGDIERLLSRVHSMSGTAGSANDGEGPTGIHPNERAVLYETGTYTKRKVGDFSKVLNGLKCATQIPEIFDGIDIGDGLLRKIVCHADRGGCFPDMVEELDWFFANFDCEQAARGLFEPSRGVDALHDEACETIERIHDELVEYKVEMCDDVLTPRSLAKSAWTYANTKPDSKDKYLIELPATVNVPDDFIMKGKRGKGHKQVNKYRTAFVQSKVDELERALDIQKERIARGIQLIFARFDAKRSLWAAAAQATALLDAISSLAQVASKAGFVRPQILDCPPDGSPSIKVTQGRHPCVENTFGSSEFVPNDLALGSVTESGTTPRVLLLSGPNMGGKSTLLRQTCLISILAQMGSYVPAEACELTPVDRIYTRLGASDRILLGQSTFFVELAETATALRGATRRSLVIMDELGRGTSTFDGTAIASAAVKHLVERSQCLSLFATHYHSLLDEWKDVSSVSLGHMECVVDNGETTTPGSGEPSSSESNITFLYTLGTGVCPKSFGINVARLAGLPEDVLVKAKRISSEFEQEISGEKNTNKALTARTAPGLKEQVLACIENGDWEQVKALHEKLKETS